MDRPSNPAKGDCPDDERMFAFLEGRGDDRAAISAHIAVCSDCRSLVSLLAGARSTSIGAPPSSPDARAVEIKPGDVVADKYEILSILGRGGMGYVALAFHRTLHQRVALKFMHVAARSDPSGMARFFREARTAASLGSEHIARAIDAGTLPSGEPFVAFEYLEGQDLAARLRTTGPLPITLAVDLTLHACEALALAHREGIVHRDIKPANLFVTTGSDGAPLLKVLDFGIAKVDSQGSVDATGPNAILGSPRYMAPEQIERSASVDARADIWALGVTLYEILSGESPFGGSTILEVCAAIAVTEPAPLTTLRPQVPPGLSAAVAAALRKDPEARVQRIRDFAAAIGPFASEDGRALVRKIERVTERTGSLPPHVEPVPLSRAPRVVAAVDDSLSASAAPRRRERRPAAIAGAVVALLALGGAATASYFVLRAPDVSHRGDTPLGGGSRGAGPREAQSADRGPATSMPALATETEASPTATATVTATAEAPRAGAPSKAPRGKPAAPPTATATVTAPPATSGKTSLDQSGLNDRK